MMSPEGLSYIYTSFINTTSSIAAGDSLSSYGKTDVVTENRSIGLSNSTVRNLMRYVYKSGNQNNVQFPYFRNQRIYFFYSISITQVRVLQWLLIVIILTSTPFLATVMKFMMI
jgi:hypothetical protein